MTHELKHEGVLAASCEHGCHTYYYHFAVCACGWRKKIEVYEYSSLKEKEYLFNYGLLHRIEILENERQKLKPLD